MKTREWRIKLNKLFKIKQGPPYEIEASHIHSVTNDINNLTGLDAGCGRKSILGTIAGESSLIIGIDEDENALRDNPDIRLGIVCSLEELPFKMETLDIINCRFVIEHLKIPEKAFKEFNRVLKPDGHLSLWTVNKYNYAMIVSRLTPISFHNFCRKIFWGAEFENVATYYKANTLKKLDLLLIKENFRRKKLFLCGGAYLYLQFSLLPYFIGLILNKISDIGCFKNLKLFIFGLYQKK